MVDIRHIAGSNQVILTRSCEAGGPCTHPQEGFTSFYHGGSLNKIGRCSFSFPLPPPLTVQQLGGTFRVPELITSDQGVQFTFAVWTSLCIMLGIQHSSTTTYYNQANVIGEFFHCRSGQPPRRTEASCLKRRFIGSPYFPQPLSGYSRNSSRAVHREAQGSCLQLPTTTTRRPPEQPPVSRELLSVKFVY
jgi:hypothetical protein